MDAKPQVIIVSPGSVLSHSGGCVRMLAMAKALGRAGFRLSLLSHDREREEILGLGIFDQVELFKTKLPIQLSGNKDFRSYIARSMDIEFNEFALDYIHRHPPCAVIAQYVWTAGVLAGLPAGVLGVLDTIDVQHLRAQVARANGIENFDRMATKEEELKELRRADIILAIQQEEKTYFQKWLPDKKIICATHTVAVNPQPSPPDSRALLFAGSNYDPNIRGIERFLSIAWPDIVKAFPNATLHVCGKVCESLWDFRHLPGVNLHGEVPSLEPFYKSAALVVNASLYGTGLPIKTSEALAYGKCLVTHPSGARGFDADTFPGIISDYDKMAETIITLLGNPARRREMELTTAKFTEDHLSEKAVFGELVAELQNTPHNTPPPSAHKRRLLAGWRDYPWRVAFYHHAALLLNRLFRFNSGVNHGGGRLLEMYVRLRWRELARDLHLQRVAIYGAGKHTRWLEWVLDSEPTPSVIAVLDDAPAANLQLFGVPVVQSDRFDPSATDAVVLSSDCIQKKLAARCRALYGEQIKLIDLYEGLPPGPYNKIR